MSVPGVRAAVAAPARRLVRRAAVVHWRLGPSGLQRVVAFLAGIELQVRLDMRSKSLLVACCLVPLLFFAVMGGIFSSVMPEVRATLV